MEDREPDFSARVAMQQAVERLPDTELRSRYDELTQRVAVGSANHLLYEHYLVGAELSRREYIAFRRNAPAVPGAGNR
jgi:preprotein translocase subunit SecA